MTEPCSSKRRGKKRGNTNTEEISSGTNRTRFDTKVLMEWTHFEEVEKILKPYVSQVKHKAVNGGYQRAREVFDDFEIFNSIRAKLTKGKRNNKLLIESYSAELSFYYALRKKSKMLRSFSTMLSDAELEDKHKKWILEQMEEDDADVLLSYAMDNIEYWDGIVNELDKDVQSEIRKQKKTKCKFLKQIRHRQNEFQDADNFDKRKGEFEELNRKISSIEQLLDDVLFKRSTIYHETLWSVGDRKTLEYLRKEFFKLLRPDEDDLAEMWLEEAKCMQELNQQDMEEKKKARDILKAREFSKY